MPCESSGSQGSARISDDGSVATTLTKTELEAAHCWEADDHVPKKTGADGVPSCAALPPGAVA